MEELIHEALRQIFGIAVGALCAYLGTKLRAKQAEIKSREEDEKLRRKVDRVILRNTIRQACKKRISKGWVEYDEKDDILECYQAYEEIIKRDNDKNGVLEDLIEIYRKLPNDPPKEG